MGSEMCIRDRLLAWLLVAGIASLLPAWSQTTTYTVTYYPVEDAYVAYQDETNYGNLTELIIDSSNRIALLKFNLSDFPLPVERIVSATLRLYVFQIEGVEGDPFVVWRATSDDWAEDTVNWFNFPGGDISVESASGAVIGWNEMDVTPIISQTLSESDKIISFKILRKTSGYDVHAYSKDAAEAQYWPQLVIEYEPYTETTTETVTETVTTTVTDYVTETQTITTTATDTIYTTETAYTTQTVTTTQTITDVITETATTTITQTETIWSNETVTVTTTITPTTTVTEEDRIKSSMLDLALGVGEGDNAEKERPVQDQGQNPSSVSYTHLTLPTN